MPTPVSRSTALFSAALLGLISSWGPAPAWAGANMKDQMIEHFCLKAVNQEFQQSGKAAPPGMAAYTCSCVVDQLNARASIDQAKVTCRQRALEKFSLAR
jgi:hypothetical protein